MTRHRIHRALSSPLLAAVVFLVTAAGAAAQQPTEAANRPDTPGTGRFPAIKEEVASLPAHVIYRPNDLAALGAMKLGVVVWATGMFRRRGEYQAASARDRLARLPCDRERPHPERTWRSAARAASGSAAWTNTAAAHEGV